MDLEDRESSANIEDRRTPRTKLSTVSRNRYGQSWVDKRGYDTTMLSAFGGNWAGSDRPKKKPRTITPFSPAEAKTANLPTSEPFGVDILGLMMGQPAMKVKGVADGAGAGMSGGGGKAGGGVVATDLPPEAIALLESISGTESRGAYNVIYGGSKFEDYSDHPRQWVLIKSGPNKGKYSNAAGKYQFISSTWDEAKRATGVPDFSPESQDKAAWWLAQRDYRDRTGDDLLTDLQSGDPATLARVGKKLAPTWTSLPNGIEQGQSTDQFVTTFGKHYANAQQAIVPALDEIEMATLGVDFSQEEPNFTPEKGSALAAIDSAVLGDWQQNPALGYTGTPGDVVKKGTKPLPAGGDSLVDRTSGPAAPTRLPPLKVRDFELLIDSGGADQFRHGTGADRLGTDKMRGGGATDRFVGGNNDRIGTDRIAGGAGERFGGPSSDDRMGTDRLAGGAGAGLLGTSGVAGDNLTAVRQTRNIDGPGQVRSPMGEKPANWREKSNINLHNTNPRMMPDNSTGTGTSRDKSLDRPGGLDSRTVQTVPIGPDGKPLDRSKLTPELMADYAKTYVPTNERNPAGGKGQTALASAGGSDDLGVRRPIPGTAATGYTYPDTSRQMAGGAGTGQFNGGQSGSERLPKRAAGGDSLVDRTRGPAAPSSTGKAATEKPKLGAEDFERLLDGVGTIGDGIGAIGDGITAETNRLDGTPPLPRPRPNKRPFTPGGDSLVDRTSGPGAPSSPKKLEPYPTLTGEGGDQPTRMPGVIDVGTQVPGPATTVMQQPTTKVIEVQVPNPKYQKNISGALGDKASDKGGNALGGAVVANDEPEFITVERVVSVPAAKTIEGGQGMFGDVLSGVGDAIGQATNFVKDPMTGVGLRFLKMRQNIDDGVRNIFGRDTGRRYDPDTNAWVSKDPQQPALGGAIAGSALGRREQRSGSSLFDQRQPFYNRSSDGTAQSISGGGDSDARISVPSNAPQWLKNKIARANALRGYTANGGDPERTAFGVA